MNRRRFLTVTAGVGTTIGLAGCVGSSAQSVDYDISMAASRFRPESFEVTTGTTVVWRNTSKQGHTVTAYEDGIPENAEYFASGGFETESKAREKYADNSAGVLGAGKVFEHEFTVPGTYNYFCIPHERVGMRGTIEVVAETSTDASQ